jgi:hypothetical protein
MRWFTIPLNDEYTLLLVPKCASTSIRLHEPYRNAVRKPGAPLETPKAVIIIREPIGRVISWWRNKVRDRDGMDMGLDDALWDIMRCPAVARDPHYLPYRFYMDGAPEDILVIPMERPELWPEALGKNPLLGPDKRNATTGDYEEPSPDVLAALKAVYADDIKLWEEAMSYGQGIETTPDG